jgi:hypothetical protein
MRAQTCLVANRTTEYASSKRFRECSRRGRARIGPVQADTATQGRVAPGALVLLAANFGLGHKGVGRFGLADCSQLLHRGQLRGQAPTKLYLNAVLMDRLTN